MIVLFLSGVNSVMEAFFFFSRDVLLGVFLAIYIKVRLSLRLIKGCCFYR